MKSKKVHQNQPIRFRESEKWLLEKIQGDAVVEKRSISSQIKYILAEYYNHNTRGG